MRVQSRHSNEPSRSWPGCAGVWAMYPEGNLSLASWWLFRANPICLSLFRHCVRAAALRTFWTVGTSRPIRMAMTTRSSINVKALCCGLRILLPSIKVRLMLLFDETKNRPMIRYYSCTAIWCKRPHWS